MKKLAPKLALAIAATLALFTGAFAQTPQIAPVNKSAIATIAMPSGTMKVQDKAQTVPYENVLRQLAAASKSQIGVVEVLVWGNSTARNEVAQSLQRGGYRYLPQPTTELEQGKMTAFAAGKESNPNEAILGIWLEQGETTLLAWTLTRAEGAAPQGGTVDNTARPQPGGTNSALGGFAMPAGATRFGDPQQAQSIATNLNAMAERAGVGGSVSPSSVEVFAWQSGGAQARNGFKSALQRAGYKVNDLPSVKNENGEFLFFSAEGPRGKVFGMWVVQGDMTMLAWGKLD